MHTRMHPRTYAYMHTDTTWTVTEVVELTQSKADHSFQYTDGPNFDMLI